MSAGTVYAVLKDGEVDGLYLFEDESDAQAFYAACDPLTTIVSDQPVADREGAALLIAAQRGEDE